MNKHMLIEAFNYKKWSDQHTLDAARNIDRETFPAAAAFVRQQINHMVIVEELFRARLLAASAPHDSTNTDVVPELDALTKRVGLSDQWFSRYVAELDAAQLSESISFRFADGQPGTMTRMEILFHIINHGTYHRGAIGHALDLAKVPHPADTYTVFIHSVEPGRRQQT